MKNWFRFVIFGLSVGIFSGSLQACTEPTSTDTVVASKESENRPGPAVIKEVCSDVTDSKGNVVRECKTIKVRKKMEGTPVPQK